MPSLNYQQHHSLAARDPRPHRTAHNPPDDADQPVIRSHAVPGPSPNRNEPSPAILPTAFSVCTLRQSGPDRFSIPGRPRLNAAAVSAISAGYCPADYRKSREFPNQNQKTSAPGRTNIAGFSSSLRTSPRVRTTFPPENSSPAIPSLPLAHPSPPHGQLGPALSARRIASNRRYSSPARNSPSQAPDKSSRYIS